MWLRSAVIFSIACSAEAATPPQPLVDYVTYLGGYYADTAVGIAVDSAGSAYIAGNTSSPDFPVTSTTLGTPSTNNCALITKLNPSGTAIDFSICLANSEADAFALDAAGNMYLLINKLVNPFFTSYTIVKIDPTGQKILDTSAPIGGVPESIVLDAAGNVYIAGAAGPGLTTTPGAYQQQFSGGQCPGGNAIAMTPCTNAFITKLSPSGAVLWSTYLGGSGPDDAHAIAVDSAGNVWIAGTTVSPNFPTTANAISRTLQNKSQLGPLSFGDAFVAKLDPTGAHLLYSTYLGGNAPDGAFALAVDSTGAAYIAGGTQSTDFPTTTGAFQTTYAGAQQNQLPSYDGNGFVTKLNSSGQLVYSTFITSNPLAPTAVYGIVVDTAGQAYLSVGSAAIQDSCSPPPPALYVMNSLGSALVATSSVPGAHLALDGKGGLYSAGDALTLVFFSTPRAFQTQYGGGDSDAFAAKVDFSQPAGPALASVLNAASFFPRYVAPNPNPTGAVAPGEIVTIFGSGFGSNMPAVTFGTLPATILYSSSCQINAVVPFGVAPALTTLVTFQSGDQTLGPLKLPVATAAPGVFTTAASGNGQAAILNQDSTVNSASNPAARGSIVSVFLTGAGLLSPYLTDGSIGPSTPPFPAPIANIGVTVADMNAPVLFAGQAPGLIAGATQVNFQIPQDAAVGAAVPLLVSVGYFESQSVTIAVR